MKKMKKIFAVILSLAMVLGMSMTAFADQKVPNVASEGDTAKVKIQDVTGNATVTLYQIAKGVYGDNGKGLIRYEYFDGITPLPEKPTSGDINAVHQEILNGNSKAEVADKKENVNGVYESIELPAGAYVAIITGAADTVYNPVLLTVSYNENGVLESGDVNVSNGYMYGSTAVAKKTSPNVDKEIIDGTTEDGDKETASVGDVITYQVTPTMPSYPENARNKTLFFSDTMSIGLTFMIDSLRISFKEDADKVVVASKDANGVVTFTTTDMNGEDGLVVATAKQVDNGFYLNFDYDSLAYGSNYTETIVADDVDNIGLNTSADYKIYTPIITYCGVLNDDAVIGGNGNINTVNMYYANHPNTGSTHEEIDNKPVPGEDTGIKEEEDTEVVHTYQLAFLKKGEGADAEKLAGAVFGIYTDKDCTNRIDVVKTNSDGYAVSSKVEAGTYYIKELVAPTGYHLNDRVYAITANWNSTTTTITTTKREWKYTTDASQSEDGVQIGWIDTKGTEDTKDDVFYSFESGVGAALPDDVDNMAITNNYLPAYVVYVNTVVTTTGKIEQDAAGAGTASSIIDTNDGDKPVDSIPNTKLASLPSTGGIGTTIFTIGGCAIMIIAAALFFASRRKAVK